VLRKAKISVPGLGVFGAAGVMPELLPQLGRPFVRGDASRGGRGSGLGLSIATRAAELHAGKLHLHNRDGGGFVAKLCLPIGAVSE